ncbi:MAG: UvrD-helicase domain-containing protein [Myxococcales bacterium]|nr:UvrD-helicase domain-containing protein [Myxococcales bacterium]
MTPDGSDLTVVRAAAGCGKTTDLARRYLGFLAAGLAVEQTIAITFTRRAAAELQERVALALRASTDGPVAEQARQRLGRAWPLYQEVAPSDPEVVLRALEQLPDAPIGTTDAFVQRLLTEFAVHAELPLNTEGSIPLDVPVRPGGGVARALDRAARRLLDPPEGGLDPDVQPLLEHLSLDEIRRAIVRRSPLDHLPPASAADVLARLSVQLAHVCHKHDLAAIYEPTDPRDAASWEAALLPKTKVAGKWAVPAVASWLAAGGAAPQAPFELAGWLVGLEVRSRARKALQADLAATDHDFGMSRLCLWDVVNALQYPYDEAGHVEKADALRRRIHRLRRRTIDAGMGEAALAGDLGYDELLEAAIALCQRPPQRLTHRFRALLVDEVQDANPAQLRLYRAIAALPGPTPITAYFVGDVRQSIYLFRHAEPQGLLDLQEASERSGTAVDLTVNHRSAPLLVQAHRDLFAAIDAPMRARRWSPPAALDALGWRDDNGTLTLDPAVHSPSEPVWLVTGGAKAADADAHALHAFLTRLQTAWSEPDHATDTAVVLAPTWRQATAACRQLRRWAGRDDIAWVDGATGWTGLRVGTDVRLFLCALQDPSDDVSWLGVYKHPSIGLSDACLARVRAGVGLGDAPARCRSLGWLLDAPALGPEHDEADRRAFAAARDPLCRAREALGRRGTGGVLDRLVTALGWRTVLAHGPGGTDDVAQLEVLLDWIRGLDTDGMSPDALVKALTDAEAEVPHVHLKRPGQHVICTTIFQAKGLAWDHCCVLSVGSIPTGGGGSVEPAWMHIDGQRARLEGVRFDPYGGITPFLDPLGRLARRLHEHRRGEESARLAYVAITRARRSVTMGLPKKTKKTERDVSDIVRDAWLAPDFRSDGVAQVAHQLPAPQPLPTAWVDADPQVAHPWRAPALPRPREERAPSSMGAHLDPDQRLQLAQSIVARVRLVNGLYIGRSSIDPPGTDPVTGLGLPHHPLGHLEPSDWGEIAHGWMAEWQFRDTLDPDEVDRYLQQNWDRAVPEVRDWILGMCRSLQSQGGPLWDLVRDPDVRLHFELPFVGLGTARDEEVLLSGRADLVVERPGGALSIVDFKAGIKVPTGWADLVDAASLRTYAPQLDAYAEAFTRMGHPVQAVALWFVRTGTSVMWHRDG